MFGVLLRFSAFIAYLFLFFVLPFAILWEWMGIALGVAFFVAFLALLKYRAMQKIQERLGAETLSYSEAPILFTLLKEHCRRLELPLPKVFVLQTDAMNSATYGFSHETSAFVVTRGVLNNLSREQLSALVARQLVTVWHRDILCATWLAQFLAFIDFATKAGTKKERVLHLRQESFGQFIRRIVLYPLALFPSYILAGVNPPEVLDSQAARFSKLGFELAEGMRLMEAMQERNPLFVKFSVRHLFLVTPSSIDPIVGVLFKSPPLRFRVDALLNLQTLQSS